MLFSGFVRVKPTLEKLNPGEAYMPLEGDYVLHSTDTIDDVLRHLLSEMNGDKEELMKILETLSI